MKRQTLVAVMAILETDESVTEEQADLVADVLAGRLNRAGPDNPQAGTEAGARVPAESSPEPYMPLKEVARRLGVSACSLWRWRVPGHELGGRPKFRLKEVEEYLHSDEFKRRAEELRREDRRKRSKG